MGSKIKLRDLTMGEVEITDALLHAVFENQN
jgi:hypothetical protein